MQLQTDLDEMAQKHSTLTVGGKAPAPGPGPAAPLPAIAQLKRSIDVLGSVESDVTAYNEPHLQLSSPAGIAANTPANAVFGAAGTSLTAGHDINLAHSRRRLQGHLRKWHRARRKA